MLEHLCMKNPSCPIIIHMNKFSLTNFIIILEITSLKYLTRLRILDEHPALQRLIDEHCGDFEELMTGDRVFSEISDDTSIWRHDPRREGPIDHGWITLKPTDE